MGSALDPTLTVARTETSLNRTGTAGWRRPTLHQPLLKDLFDNWFQCGESVVCLQQLGIATPLRAMDRHRERVCAAR